MKWIFLSLLTLVFWVGLYLYIYLGFSKPVVVELTDSPQMVLVFKRHLGAYHKVNDTIEGVEKIFKNHHIPCPKTFGEYPDDPEIVDEDRLVSNVGCVFYKEASVLKEIAQKNSLEYQVRMPHRVIEAQFSGSPAVGPVKVYPKIDKMIQDQRLVRSGILMEVYEIQGDQVTTTYLQPVQ